MRIVIYGAGAVGGVIGGRLFQNGHEVLLVARGRHLSALQHRGLTIRSPEGSATLEVPVVGHSSEIRFRDEDVVLLSTKTQHSAQPLAELQAESRGRVAVVCAQNGVENERLASRRFARVYGMMVWMPATFLEPGVVQIHSAPLSGFFGLGRWPTGVDALAGELARLLDGSGFRAVAVEDVRRWKYGKLLTNLGNAMEAACGPDAELEDIQKALEREALACYRAAGIEWTSTEEMHRHVGEGLGYGPVGGREREGGSSWQSLARGTGTIEADYLNGEIVLLGRLHGVPTPMNQKLQELASRLARERRPPGSLGAEGLRLLVGGGR